MNTQSSDGLDSCSSVNSDADSAVIPVTSSPSSAASSVLTSNSSRTTICSANVLSRGVALSSEQCQSLARILQLVHHIAVRPFFFRVLPLSCTVRSQVGSWIVRLAHFVCLLDCEWCYFFCIYLQQGKFFWHFFGFR